MDSLDFQSELCGHDSLMVHIPPFRVDVVEEIDLIEEVARLYGYDKIEATIPSGVLAQDLNSHQQRDCIPELVTDMMLGFRLDQALTYSFIGDSAFDKLELPDDSLLRQVLRLQHPLREDQSVMRTLLLPGLMEAVASNWKRKQADIGFFEVGTVFEFKGADRQPDEKKHLGIAACGVLEGGWQGSRRKGFLLYERDYQLPAGASGCDSNFIPVAD